MFRSRLRRVRRMQNQSERDEEKKPRYVPNDEFFNAPLTDALSNPNASRIKRVKIN